MKPVNENLSKLSLLDLHILKTHARISLTDMERLMGKPMMGEDPMLTFEAKEFQTLSNIHKLYEAEMNRRILENVIY